MSADPSALAVALRKLAGRESLTEDETAAAFDVIMRGEATAAQAAAILMALRVKGETPSEVAGGARALRNTMIRLDADAADELVDTCGTGGGQVPTFNISTAAALVAAGAGVRIAKHGNRSFTTRSGSADVLEALGIPLDVPVDTMRRTLAEAGIVFMFAPLMHPAMRHVGPIRRELGVGTVMNMLGPLANPAGAGRQVVGVSDEHRLALIAGALAALDTRHAMVVHGDPGLDEISPLGCTRVLEVRGGAVIEWTVDPREHGLGGATVAEIAGGEPVDNARIIMDVLSGRGTAGARAAVVLNAAAAVYVGGRAASYAEGLQVAASALDAGRGLAALERLRTASRR